MHERSRKPPRHAVSDTPLRNAIAQVVPRSRREKELETRMLKDEFLRLEREGCELDKAGEGMKARRREAERCGARGGMRSWRRGKPRKKKKIVLSLTEEVARNWLARHSSAERLLN